MKTKSVNLNHNPAQSKPSGSGLSLNHMVLLNMLFVYYVKFDPNKGNP